jgi:hypothetical protein
MSEARAASLDSVPISMNSSRSLPEVNTPEPPVMTRQRMSGLFCAVSIASLMRRYIAWVSAFFFSGRLSLMTRAAPSSVTITWSVMLSPLRGLGRCCAALPSESCRVNLAK